MQKHNRFIILEIHEEDKDAEIMITEQTTVIEFKVQLQANLKTLSTIVDKVMLELKQTFITY